MNRQDREALVEKVRRSENPFEALFGTGPKSRRKRLTGGSGLPPRSLMPDRKEREKLHLRTVSRVLQIMKHLDPDLYADLYRAEIRNAVSKLESEQEVQKVRRRFIPAKQESGGSDGG